MLQTSRDFSSNATARVLARCRSATERTGRPAATLPRAAPERSEPKNLRRTTSLAFAGSGDVGVRVAQVVLHGPLGDAEGTADADGGELAGVDEAVHGHLRDPHHRGDLGDGQEAHGGAGGRDGRTAHRHGGRGRRGDRAGPRGGGPRAAGGAGAGEARARGVGTVGRPTGMAAGCAGATGRAIAAAVIGRPRGRGPGSPGRATAVARWGMVMSSSPDLAHVVAPASPPATEHACAATERKGTGVTGAMGETNRRTGPSWAEVHLCNTAELSNGELCDAVMSR